MGIYWEYNGIKLGMRLIFTDDNQHGRERLWELSGNEQGMISKKQNMKEATIERKIR